MEQITSTISFTEKLENIAGKVGSVLELIMQVLCCIVAGIILLPFALIYWVIAFNPVSFWVWAMLAPKSAANSLGDRGTNKLMAPVHDFLWNLNRKFRWALPWRSRKHFLWATQLAEATVQEQLFFFRKEGQFAEEILKNNWLNKEAKNELWPEVDASLRAIMLPKMGTLTQKQFLVLIHNREWNLIREYTTKYTPSEQVLLILLDEAAKNAEVLNLLVVYTRGRSLPARVITQAYRLGKENLVKELEKALESYRQRSMVKLYAAEREKWELFLTDLGEIELFEENQRLMTRSQYSVYHHMGRKLTEGAIISFLSQDDMDMAKMVLSYEVKNNDLISNNIKSLIAANASLTRMLLEMR